MTDKDPLKPLRQRVKSYATRASTNAAGEPPEFCGRKLFDVLGRGGQGSVFRGHDAVLGRDVAIKITTATGDDRDLREARALAAVRHPNVVHVYEVEVIDGYVVTTMELLEGRRLDDWLATRPSVNAVLDVLGQIGDGLAAIHAVGLAHRDIKPTNIVVASSGRAVLVDLGLARSEGAVGTPGHLAPEVEAGAVPDQRSDQFTYALVVQSALEHVGAPGLARVFLRRALAERPRDRWPSVAEGLTRLPRRSPWRLRVVVSAAALVGLLTGATAAPGHCEASIVPAWVESVATMGEARELAARGRVREAHDAIAKVWPDLMVASPAMAAASSADVADELAVSASNPTDRVIAAMVSVATFEAFEAAGDGERAQRYKEQAALLLDGFDDEGAARLRAR